MSQNHGLARRRESATRLRLWIFAIVMGSGFARCTQKKPWRN